MGGEATVAPWLQLESLFAFVDDLRRARYRLDLRHYARVQDLALAIAAAGIADDNPRQLRSLLGPVVCQSAAEQAEFPRLFDAWLARLTTAPIERNVHSIDDTLQHARRRSRQWLWSIVAVVALLSVAVWVYLSIPAPTITASPSARGPSIVVSPEVDAWTWVRLGIGVALLCFAGGAVWAGLWLWFGRRYLKRESTTARPAIETLKVSTAASRLFDVRKLTRIAAGFRTRIASQEAELAVSETIEKTIRQGGLFSLVLRRRRVLPEYIALIERSHSNDHQAAFVDELLGALLARGVFITRFYFDADPRVCFPERPTDDPVPLRRLAQRYGGHRLLVFAATSAFADPVSGRFAPWVADCLAWNDRALFVPGPERVGTFEEELSRLIPVLPGTLDGLLAWTASLHTTRHVERPASGGAARALPTILTEEPERWLSRIEPDHTDLDQLVTALRANLSAHELAWVSACAMYPSLQWNLTSALGRALKNGNAAGQLNAEGAATIAQLPWFRYGFMPDWLRGCLVDELSRAELRAAQRTLDSLLLSSLQGGTGDFALEIARTSPIVGRMGSAVRRALTATPDALPELRDYVFMRAMAGRRARPLSVRLPDGFRRLFTHAAVHESAEAMWAPPQQRSRGECTAVAAGYAVGPFALVLGSVRSAFVRFHLWQITLTAVLFWVFVGSIGGLLNYFAWGDQYQGGNWTEVVAIGFVGFAIVGWCWLGVHALAGRAIVLPWIGRVAWGRAFQRRWFARGPVAPSQWLVTRVALGSAARTGIRALLGRPSVFVAFASERRSIGAAVALELMANLVAPLAIGAIDFSNMNLGSGESPEQLWSSAVSPIGPVIWWVSWRTPFYLVAWVLSRRTVARGGTSILRPAEGTARQSNSGRKAGIYIRLFCAFGLTSVPDLTLQIMGLVETYTFRSNVVNAIPFYVWLVPYWLLAARAVFVPPRWGQALLVSSVALPLGYWLSEYLFYLRRLW